MISIVSSLPQPPLILRLLPAVQGRLVEEERLPYETGTSYPLPALISEGRQVCGFHLLPDWENGKMAGFWVVARYSAEYAERLNITEFSSVMENQNPFPNLPLEKVSAAPPPESDPAARDELEETLFASFEEVLEAYYSPQPAPPLAKTYWHTILRLSPPALIPYYAALNPAFIKWVSR